MILGIGSDLVDIRRIESALARFGARFEQRLFSDGEQRKAQARANPAATYAKRFAAKEACAKALGSGMNHGVRWRDMEVVNLPSGAPTLRLHHGALMRLEAMTPGGHAAQVHLSMSDEYPYAQAQVIISAEKI